MAYAQCPPVRQQIADGPLSWLNYNLFIQAFDLFFSAKVFSIRFNLVFEKGVNKT